MAWLCARGSSPAFFTACACTAPTRPTQGHRCNPNKLLVDPYAKAIHGDVDWRGPVLSGYKVGNPEPDLSFDEQDSAGSVPQKRRRQPEFFSRLDGGSPSRHALAPHRDLPASCERLHQAPSRHPPKSCAVPMPGSLTLPPIAISSKLWASPQSSSCPSSNSPIGTGFLRGPSSAQLLGLQHARFFCAQAEVREGPRRNPGAQVNEFKAMVKALHAAGDRSHPRRGLQPYLPRAIISAPPSHCAVSTTPLITG